MPLPGCCASYHSGQLAVSLDGNTTTVGVLIGISKRYLPFRPKWSQLRSYLNEKLGGVFVDSPLGGICVEHVVESIPGIRGGKQYSWSWKKMEALREATKPVALSGVCVRLW